MALLVAFAFVAGAATSLSPCVLPVLPIALSAGITGGHRRPLGVVTGLTLSFTFATVALVYVIDAFSLPDDLLRNLAIGVLLAFGATLAAPPLAARVEAAIARVAPVRRMRGPSDSGRSTGFLSGVVLGLSLGAVYAPCAGPILAAVITVSAAQPFAAGRLAVAASYSAGCALVLYLLMLGGRRLAGRLAPYAGRLRPALGVVMVATGVLMLADYDLRFQTAIASELPSFVINPSRELEDGQAVRAQLARLQQRRRPDVIGQPGASGQLPVVGPAPDLAGAERWLNTPDGRPLSLAKLRGRVVLVDFWTYSCINCIRTLPYLKAWDARYRKRGLTVVGVHAPEFPFERDVGNVRSAIARNGLRYPVAQDNRFAIWEAYANEYWPAKYLIDARGRLRYEHFGEGAYAETEAAIRRLLAEGGDPVERSSAAVRAERASDHVATPESYLGAARAERFANGAIRPGRRFYRAPHRPLADNQLAFEGTWDVAGSAARTVRGARLHLAFGARRVFVVMGAGRRPIRPVRVLLDGRPVPDRLAGSDVRSGRVLPAEHRLYRLLDLGEARRGRLTLVFPPGVSAHAFTFG